MYKPRLGDVHTTRELISRFKGYENNLSIDENAFAACNKLVHINLENVITISRQAFAGCKNLSAINLSKDVSISGNPFRGCDSLSDKNGMLIIIAANLCVSFFNIYILNLAP